MVSADRRIEMADTLVDDFDVLEFLHTLTERCVQFPGVSAAGLMVTDAAGKLRVVAASSERTRLLELFELQTDEGPCVECFHTAAAVSVENLSTAGRWPRFTAAASEVGYAAVHALPMKLRPDVVGALNLFGTEPGASIGRSCGSGRPWPTSPPSACCNSVPSAPATC